MPQQILLRRGTAAAWTSANPVLGDGEPGYEKDTGKVKVGDGVTAWTSLVYSTVTSVVGRTGAVTGTQIAADPAISPTVAAANLYLIATYH